ncbi:helix-turn-helix transcriptional regulator [Streptomyces sp. BHT-5-2]|uniref:helix-turn-helix domain-containing protein n=1 Tax=unclassified Streptomyces TaxID=2593676 RepID=UPI001C8EB620|nr:helix-turn-helix transcriptional regulator [Streptomyces sp. BHT-5-2]QZL02493.1 helix-turn-helix transcriptional regulator [Streptomyces sp. BHT-5-2]
MAHFPDMQEADSNGQRLARIRMRRRWTQQRLATETGYSISAVKAFEQGRRALDRPAVILSLCRVLDCHPAEITGGPVIPPQSDLAGQAAVAGVAAVRRAVLRHGRPARPTEEEVANVDLVELRTRTRAANDDRHAAKLASAGETLPVLLRDLQVAAEVSEGTAHRAAFSMLATAYECAMQYLYKLGHVSDATLATERVVWSAEATGDPLRVLAAQWYDAGEFLNIGEHDEAGAIIDDALTTLTRVPSPPPEAVSLRGAFELKAALNHARAAEKDAADRHWRRAESAAHELGGDRDDWHLQFGPTNVAIWGVSLPVELGQGRLAVDRAKRVRLPETYSRERRSHHFIDIGRAHFYNGQRDQALDAFLQAERLAPQATRMHAGVRETVGTMLRTQKRGRLAELGIRLGVV